MPLCHLPAGTFFLFPDLSVDTQYRMASQCSNLPGQDNWFMLGQRTHQRQNVVVSFLCQGRLWKGGRFFDQALPDVCKGTRQVHVQRGCWLMNFPLQRTMPRDRSHLKLSGVRLWNHPRVADHGHGWRLLSTSLPLHPLLRFLNK